MVFSRTLNGYVHCFFVVKKGRGHHTPLPALFLSSHLDRLEEDDGKKGRGVV
jgi:hypothetical protein